MTESSNGSSVPLDTGTSSLTGDLNNQPVNLGTGPSEQSIGSQIQIPTLTAEMISKLDPPVIQLFQSLANLAANQNAAGQRGEVSKKPLNDVKLKKFNGKPADYPNFRADLIRHLTARQQNRFIENDIYRGMVPPTPQQISEDVDVQLFIAGNCTKTVKDHIQSKAKTASHMLELLDAQYGQAGQCLINEAINFVRTGQLSTFSDLEEYIRRFEAAFDVLEQNGMGLTDKAKSKFFFCGMGKVRNQLEQYTLTSKMSYNEVLGYVRDHFSSDQDEHVQYAVHPGAAGKRKFEKGEKSKSNWRYFKRGGFKGRGGHTNPYKKDNSKCHDEKSEKSSSKDESDDESLPKKFKRTEVTIGGGHQKSKQLDFNLAKSSPKSDNFLLSSIFMISSIIFTLNIKPDKNLWLFDTGAFYKICNNIQYFTKIDYFQAPYEVAYSISGSSIPIKGIGTVKLLLKSGLDLIIENVRFMPDAMASCLNHKDPGEFCEFEFGKENDFYVRMRTANEGYQRFLLAKETKIGPVIQHESNFSDVFINVTTRSGIETHSDRESDYDSDFEENIGLDKLTEFSKVDDHLIIPDNYTKDQVHSISVHRSKGHPGKAKTKLEVEKYGFTFADYLCNLCAKHKLVRKINKVSTRLAKRVLEFVSSDTSGRFRRPCYDGSEYFIVFVDHYSKYKHLEFFRTKDEVPKIIENFVAFAQKQTGKKIKIFRSDRGTEFTNDSVRVFLKGQGIHPESSAPYTHYQNGVSENAIRSLKTKAKILIDEFGHIDKHLLWGEALRAAAFLYNRTANSSLHDKTPAEVFGMPNFDLPLYPWGSRVYALNKHKESSDEPNSTLMYLVGYDQESKAYRLYDRTAPPGKRLKINNDIAPIDTFIRVSTKSRKRGVADEAERPAKRICSNVKKFQQVADNLLENDHFENVFNNALISSTLFENVPKEFNKIDPHDIVIPKTYEEAISSKYSEHWQAAMQAEYDAMLQNKVWRIVPAPKGVHILSPKWVYAVKYNPDGSVARFKARLVAKGYNQIEGLDYDEVFSPTLSLQNTRLLLNIALQFDLEMHTCDFSTAYLNADLDKVIYLRQAKGFDQRDDLVCVLDKALYGLKQSGRMWNHCLADALIEYGLTRCQKDDCIFVDREKMFVVATFVDDLLILPRNQADVTHFVKFLQSKFKLVYNGKINKFLGTHFVVEKDSLLISAKSKIIELANKCGIDKYRKANTPMRPSELLYPDENGTFFEDIELYQSVTGSLLFIARLIRPEILFAVIQLTKFASNPLKVHYEAALRIVQYLFNTVDLVLKFEKPKFMSLTGFSDSDWANDVIDRKSYSGYTIYLNGNPVVWSCSKQKLISQSSDEAEIIAANEATRELTYCNHLFKEITGHDVRAQLFTDNAGVIRTSDRGFGKKTKHISVRELYIRQQVKRGELDVIQIKSEQNVADIFTKSVNLQLFNNLKSRLNLENDKGKLAKI